MHRRLTALAAVEAELNPQGKRPLKRIASVCTRLSRRSDRETQDAIEYEKEKENENEYE